MLDLLCNYVSILLVWGSVFGLNMILASLWLWLYAGAGTLLKAARRFDIGFEWFN
jgi:hypothetical protein